MKKAIAVTTETICPQEGFQENFLTSKADIVIGGGAAGVGKTFALLLETIRNTIPHYKSHNISAEEFNAVIFRRKATQISNLGGVWDESEKMFPKLGAKSNLTKKLWTFPSGATIKFTHLIHEKTKYDHKGGQYGLICFDELDLFSESQFWYLLSRNRSVSKVRPYVRATTNPQRSGWVKDLIQWWIYPDDEKDETKRGYPIPERLGKVRYFIRKRNKIYWGDSKMEIYEKHTDYINSMAKPANKSPFNYIQSLTFIPGKLTDNQALLSVNPQYQANLASLPKEERERLYLGSWKYIAGEEQLFDNYKAIQDLFSNDFIKGTGEMFMTADIAFMGADKFAIGIWDGLRLIKTYEYPKTEGDEIVKILQELSTRHHVPKRNIIFDGDGGGLFLKGYLKSSYSFRGSAAPISAQAFDPYGRVEKEEKSRYANLRAQGYYKLRELVNASKMYAFDLEPDIIKMIKEELEAIDKKPVNEDDKLRIEKKEKIIDKLGRSPDYADMLMMRTVPELVENWNKHQKPRGYIGSNG